jgi:hypothetical protein
LIGEPNSPEFITSYHAAQGSRFDRLALPGGIRRSRTKRNPDAVQPLIGVYLLMLKGKIVYIGSSMTMPDRVAGHRSNGRPFDQVFFIATAANQREMLERIPVLELNGVHHKHTIPMSRAAGGAPRCQTPCHCATAAVSVRPDGCRHRAGRETAAPTARNIESSGT